VDTGATVSLISRELISGPLKPCSLKARGIGGEELQVLGMKELEVSIGTLTISHQFMVVGIRNTCILAADFLKSGRMVVFIANSKLTWPSGEVALVIETTAPTVNKLSVLLDNYSDIACSAVCFILYLSLPLKTVSLKGGDRFLSSRYPRLI
jgi:hypothetical protein